MDRMKRSVFADEGLVLNIIYSVWYARFAYCNLCTPTLALGFQNLSFVSLWRHFVPGIEDITFPSEFLASVLLALLFSTFTLLAGKRESGDFFF